MSGAWSSVEVPGARTRRWQARANGQTYRISVWVPPGTPPPGGFPAVYVLDANALFGTFVELVRRSSRRPDATGIVPTAVVGIAHDGDALFAEPLRRRDFTAGPSADGSVADGVGGASGFLAFIADELLPALRAELPLDSAGQTLFGHSLAGHFVLQALAARPRAFRTWAAVSPSVWWDEAGLRAALAAALPGQPDPRVFMAAGAWEDAVPPWQRQQPGYDQLVARRAQRRMVASAQALAEDMTAWLGAERLAFRIFPDEDHASVVMVAAQRVLRFCSA
ncbi:ferri-bacillibactin esterase BesA [Pseudorhodoferax aquiterrae]|uniref:Ferri-bacillibactin esterase BesA n=1 Tax=Pseudorhodoferax aquiterrae TaxID=747304 RepID=A0ABQ3FWN6_9BURK|nr:alpha/beta hydrolase-fold protein [Pseudorhodoferax aquiterrae]GHC71816.1 ferri-bacillibactin esterase BesA [Pseudorhodoferax aquiterrae]